MAFLLVLFGGVLVDVGIRNTADQLGALLKSDVPGFVPWAGAMFIIGMLGYIKTLRTPSHILLGLVILVLFLSNHGIFANLQQAFTNPPAPSTPETLPASDVQALQQGPTVNINVEGGGGSSAGDQAGGILSGIAGAFKIGSIFGL